MLTTNEKQYRKRLLAVIYFGKFLLVAIVLFIALTIAGFWYPVLHTVTDWLAVALNLVTALFLVFHKERIENWRTQGLSTKALWWFAFLINVVMFAYNLVSALKIDLWGWVR